VVRNALWTMIFICIAPLWLPAQTQSAAPAPNPAKSSIPPQMPSMETPRQPNALSHQNQQTATAENPGTVTGSQMPLPQLFNEPANNPPMHLRDFEDLALANNPTLKQANDLVGRSAAEARQAGLYPNPSAGYEGSEIRGGSFGGGEEGGFVQQTIVLGGKLGLRKRVFQEQQREDEAGLSEQRYRLLADVDQRFYSALAAQEIMKLRENLLTVTADAMQTAHQLANVGQADEPDVLQAEVEADRARVDYETAQRSYFKSFETLAATVGKPGLALSRLVGNLSRWPELHPEQIVQTILRDSPEVKLAQQAVARAEAEVRSAGREAIPDIQLRAGIQQDNEALNEAAIRQTPAGVIGFGSVSINLPIFNRNQGNVAAARAELERAREEVTRVQLSLRRRAEPLLEAYGAEELQASEYKGEMIPKALRAYQLYLDNYRHMAAAYPEVLISQRTLFELEVGYVRALDHLWQNAITLQNFVLSDGLKAPMPSGTSSTTINLPSGGAQPGE
jgi:outer membrane protein, heavy metal efflux system